MCVGSLAEVGLFQFSHKSFPDWLSTNERFRVERKDGERLLGSLCRAIVVREEVVEKEEEEEAAPGGAMIRDGAAAATNYALRNVIAHLVESGERESARELLMDVGYLCRRAEEGAALVQDCQRLEGDRTVELIGRAIGLSLSDLRKDPRRMRGQLVGRLLSVVREVREGGGGEGEGKEGVGGVVREEEDERKRRVKREIGALLERAREEEVGYDWWCPRTATMEQAEAPCLRKMVGHGSGVTSVAYSMDGTRVVSGSEDKTVRIWDASTGEEVQRLEGHSGEVSSVAFSMDGTRVVSGSDDKTVRIWDASTGEEVQKLEGHSGGVTSVAFSMDGTRVVSGSGDKTVRIWDASTGEEVQKLEGHSDWVSSVAFSMDGTRVVSGSGIRQYEFGTRRRERRCRDSRVTRVGEVGGLLDGRHQSCLGVV